MVDLLWYVVYKGVWLGAGNVCVVVVWACVCGKFIWWGCGGSVVVMLGGWCVRFKFVWVHLEPGCRGRGLWTVMECLGFFHDREWVRRLCADVCVCWCVLCVWGSLGLVCGASDVSATSLRCVNGGEVLIYRII